MKKLCILLLSTIIYFSTYAQNQNAYFNGTSILSDTNWIISAQGLYMLRHNVDTSIVFFADYKNGAQLSLNTLNDATGVSGNNVDWLSQIYYSGQGGNANIQVRKADSYGQSIATVLVGNSIADTLAGVVVKKDSIQFVSIKGTDTVRMFLPNQHATAGQVLSSKDGKHTEWITVSGTVGARDTAIAVKTYMFTGSNYYEPLLVNNVPDTRFLFFSDEGTGGLLNDPNGYTFDRLTGIITTSPGNYRLLILR